MIERLADPALYLASAERVRARQQRSVDVRPLCPDGPRLSAISASVDSLAIRLAREVAAGRYAFAPVLRRQACIEGKERALYLASPLDDIVLGALAQCLTELIDASLSEHVHSYRRGRSPWTAIDAFRGHVRAHVAARPDPRTRGLYVVRRDVRGYGDAIPVAPTSALWTQLTAALERAGAAACESQLRWLMSAFRPRVANSAGPSERPTEGVPTGSPLQPIACNLYLGPIDRLCERVPGAFYARYGDDMLFAHPDAAVADASMQAMDACIAELGLELSADKCAAYYFTRAGRASEHATFHGVSTCDYLGVRVDFRGSIGLKRDKLHALLDDVHGRLTRSAALLRAAQLPVRAPTLCEIVNAALDPSHAVAHRSALALQRVDDRGQLRDLDYKLASLVAQTLSGRTGVRALRHHPPRLLREQGRLLSLVRQRNRAGRRSA